MELIPDTLTPSGRQALRRHLLAASDTFIWNIPKIELHIHIEGTLTPSLLYKLAKRNGIPIRLHKDARELQSLAEVEEAYALVISSAQLPQYKGHAREDVPATFFEAYYSGCDVLRTKDDFFDLAWDYFERAAKMNVRYCEIFFDPQTHTARGVTWADLMGGLRDAQVKAETELNIKSGWVMCFLRDSPLASAQEHYQQALKYRNMIIGFGLDSNETNHPPDLFDDVFAVAREAGFRITAHCDVGQKDTHRNIHHVVARLGGNGADRIDHGLNAADKEELWGLIKDRDLGMTICPWAYLRRWTYEECAQRIRILVREGIKMCISSDSGAYMDDTMLLHNLLVTRKMAGLSDKQVLEMMKVSVGMSWAEERTKNALLKELTDFGEDNLQN